MPLSCGDGRLRCLGLPLLLLSSLLAGCASTGGVGGRADRFETVSATVDFSFVSPRESLSGRGYLSIRYPDRFRFTVATPFGGAVADVVGDGERLLFVDHRQRIWFRQHRGENGFPFADLLFRIPEGFVPTSPPCVPGGGMTGFILEEMVDVSGVCLPRRMSRSAGGASMVLFFDDHELNVPLPPDSFAVELEGYREMIPPSDERRFR